MKVHLHIGAGKTGTSAIQVALAQNRDALAAAGVSYPLPPDGENRAARGEISSGNARLLGWFCNPNLPMRDASRELVLGWIERCVAEAAGGHLLFSSEAMQAARPEEAGALIALFRRAGYEPQVIFYARHVLDHAVAEYLQHVKMGYAGLAMRDQVRSLETFLPHYRCRFPTSLAAFANHLPREAVQVRLYDSEKAHLVPNFFALLGLPAPVAPPAAAAERIVNRSLAPEELPLFEHLARMPDGTRLCRLLTDLLLNAPAKSGTRFVVSEAAFEACRRRNQPALDEMNATWLAGRPPEERLLMTSGRVLVGSATPPTPEEVAAQIGDILALVLRETGRHGPAARRAAVNQAQTRRPGAAGPGDARPGEAPRPRPADLPGTAA